MITQQTPAQLAGSSPLSLRMYHATGEYTADAVIGECAGTAIAQARVAGEEIGMLVGTIQFHDTLDRDEYTRQQQEQGFA